MQVELVDLDDHTVDLVLNVVPVGAVVLDKIDNAVDVCLNLGGRARRQTPVLQQRVHLALRGNRGIRPRTDAVY